MQEDEKSLNNTNQCKSIYTILKDFFMKRIYGIFIILGFSVLAVFIYRYLSNFGESLLTENSNNNQIAKFGQFGDFIGGLLNPFFAFLSVSLLLVTIKTQSDEMEETKKIAKDSAEALKEQSNSIKLQNFENTFFNMINLHNEIVSNLSLIQLRKTQFTYLNGTYYCYSILGKAVHVKEDQDYNGKKVLSKLLEIINVYIRDKDANNITNLYNKFYLEYNEIIGHYFRNIYQILKFINTQEVLKNEDKNKELRSQKIYANILRSQLSNSELALLFLNGLSKEGEEKLLPLLIKYEFMEPLSLSLFELGTQVSVLKSIIDISYLDNLINLYIEKTKYLNINNKYSNNKIFGSNREWERYINYLNTSSQEQQ